MPTALNNQNVSSRLSEFAPPAISILAALVIFALSLGAYYLHYFPYEDDFSLIRNSAVQNSPAPVTWITKGFSDYFANDPQCATRAFGFDRPVANATFYLESLLYRSAEGPLLLMTNVLCWIVSAWFIYGIARRLGASRWIASFGILLYALSPCWYRVLIHASFRNNGLAACFLLAAAYVLLQQDGVRSWARLVLAGVLIALAAGSHEQGFTGLPVFAVGVAWLSFKAEGKWRTGRIALAITAVVLPSLLMWGCFRLMNPMYGSSYVTAGFLGSLTQSRRLTSLGIHSSLLIGTVKLIVRVFGALISAMGAFTPLSPENMADLNPFAGSIIFVLTLIASIAIIKRFPRQIIPVIALILCAVGRSVGIPSAEARFTHMEVAWGIIALVCALSAGIASSNRLAVTTGTAAALGLLAFNIFSYNATIVMRHSILQRRNEVDREAFYRIKAAASKYPGAQVILVNDHAGIASARDMLILAGLKSNHLEILPTVMNGFSTDTLRDVAACPATTQFLRLPVTMQIRLDYPTGCAVSFFGRDMECMVKQYRLAGRSHSAAWAAFVQDPENQGRYAPPLIHDAPIQPGKPLLLVVWRDRLSVPDVTPMPNENEIPLDWQATR
jgi:hypothetical protein